MAFKLGLTVWTLEGEVLLPAGTVLTRDLLEGIAAAGRRRSWERRPLLGHGTVRRDIERGAGHGEYARVFRDPKEYRALERLMGTVELPDPCLRSLDWFRDHDPPTYRHVLMVFALSCLLVDRLGLEGDRAASEVVAGPLHDLGKLCVPVTVLGKRTPLTREERATLEQHTLAGHVLLCHYFSPEDVSARVARDHHERRDGSGYPGGISLADRLVEVVAACDVYDALVSPRPYRKQSYDGRSALEELTELAARGTLGWDVVRLLVSLHRSDRPAPEKIHVSLEKRGHAPAGNLYGVFEEETES